MLKESISPSKQFLLPAFLWKFPRMQLVLKRERMKLNTIQVRPGPLNPSLGKGIIDSTKKHLRDGTYNKHASSLPHLGHLSITKIRIRRFHKNIPCSKKSISRYLPRPASSHLNLVTNQSCAALLFTQSFMSRYPPSSVTRPKSRGSL